MISLSGNQQLLWSDVQCMCYTKNPDKEHPQYQKHETDEIPSAVLDHIQLSIYNNNVHLCLSVFPFSFCTFFALTTQSWSQ